MHSRSALDNFRTSPPHFWTDLMEQIQAEDEDLGVILPEVNNSDLRQNRAFFVAKT